MITKEELNEAKIKRKTNLYYEEKEYLQYIFLKSISKFSENFIFKGGTCLRICYGYERASEDLDFNSNLEIKKIKEIVKESLKNFEMLNIEHQIILEKEFEGNLRSEIRFKGPLYSGNPSSTNTLKIDFNKGKARYKIAKAIPKLFSDIPIFTIFLMEEKEILAEKIRALINRVEARDLYDLWMLLQNKISFDKALIKEKLKEEKSDISKLSFPSKEEYTASLKPLLATYLPPYEQVKKEVEEALIPLRS